MAAVDTNVLVRLLVEDDEEQAGAARAFVRATGRVFVSHVVLVEASWVLSSAYGLTRQQIARTVELVLATDAFHLERPEILTDSLATFRDSKADFADCVIAATARAAGEAPLATFDAAAARLPGARKLGGKRKKSG